MQINNKGSKKSWQKSAWVQWVAIAVVLGIYGSIILFHLQNRSPQTFRDIFLYTTVISSAIIIVLLLVQRFFLGERIQNLNLKAGSWWKDLLAGIFLAAITLGTKMLLDNPINTLFHRQPNSGLGTFFSEMIESPIKLALMVGPGLIIGAGISEELTRVFLLNRFWSISHNNTWRWMAVILSAVIFGLGHLYQGTAGIVSTGISGLILAVYYLIFGRLNVMIIAHYLHDAFQFIFAYIMVRI